MEQQQRSEEMKQQIVLAAINSLGTVDPSTSRTDFEVLVADRASQIAGLLRDNAMPMKVLDAIPIPGVIVDVNKEESSNRGIVTLRAYNAKDGETETFRTPRLENDFGKHIYHTAHKLIGKQVVLMKITETRKDDPNRKVRIVVGIQPSN